MKRISKKLFFTLCFIFLTLPFFSLKTEAYAKLEKGFYSLSTMLTQDKLIDVQWASKDMGANIQLYDKNKSTAQIFYISPTDDGYYTIQAVCSGHALDVQNGQAFHGANVWQWEVNGTDAQKWQFDFINKKVVSIKSKLGDYYLDVDSGKTENETNIRIWGWNGSSAQKFKLKKIDLEKNGISGKKTYSERRFTKLNDYFSKYYSNRKGQYALVIGSGKGHSHETFQIGC